ncbi:hypothetical protein A2954_02215 [Candidatus Roizmanbacteria bacterium RIFCSPLOWO2_01_FULL_37_12]|uniref:DUF2726 domain-containing protein n=1 Tax=Candidatus Roizmanbacteria bacterium RIFCSPLOWO2_01_FULL_37_12 TaxID=1802056 RepID=A0A1F7I8A3_9BACT|nr:MAG: hypothetical protein A2954_02215 [Candidatus Roizmanbacteria bacterium RIFCSPLOWO2_01_FULL_37_12]
MQPIIYFLFILIFTIILLLIYIIIEKRKRENIEEALLQTMFSHDKINVKDELLTHNEQRFYRDLQKVFGEEYYIFSHVSLTSLLKIRPDQKDLYEKHANINKFYFDFVLVAKEQFKPVLVVELNDRTHGHNKRFQRDAYFSSMLASADIRHFSCESNFLTYDHYMEEIKKILHPSVI